MSGASRRALENVECNIVAGIHHVVTEYVLVDMGCHCRVEFGLCHRASVLLEPCVNARSGLVEDTSLVAHDTGVHAQHIVLRTLLPPFDVTFELEFLRLEIVARVVLVGYGQRHDVQGRLST